MKLAFLTFVLSGFLAGLVGAQTIRINAGGPEQAAGSNTPSYQPDQYFTGGAVFDTGLSGVWQTQRYGATFAYDVPLVNGLYRVTLLMLDATRTGPKQRLFTISANGVQTPPLDLFALAGGRTEYRTELLTLVWNGRLRIQFTATLWSAVVNAIEIVPLAYLSEFKACIGVPRCAGLFYGKVHMTDGTEAGPFILVPMAGGLFEPGTFAALNDPAAWKPDP